MDGSAVEVWNAATALGPRGTGGPDVPTGTAHLARLLRFHNAAMGGGLGFALEVTPADQLEAVAAAISPWLMSPRWSGAWPPMGAISTLRRGSTMPTARPPGRPGSATARSNARSFALSPPRPGTSGDALDPVVGRPARAPSARCAAAVDGCVRLGRRGRVDEEETDYWWVGEEVEDYADAVEVRGVSALILANGNAPTTFVPAHRLLVQRITWDPTADVVANALRLFGSIRWHHETTWVSQGPVLSVRRRCLRRPRRP